MSAVAAEAIQPTPTEPSHETFHGTVSLNLLRARRAFRGLEQWLLSEGSCQLPLHDVEREQERRAREIHRPLLEAHVARRGSGGAVPAVEVQGAPRSA
jgi:hypothetical protein